MPKAKPKAEVHEAFKNRINDLCKQAKEQAMAGMGSGVRPWQVPADYEGSVLDVPELHEPPYNRDDINTQYVEVLSSGGEAAGTSGDTVGLKNQINYMACEERAYRLRQATMVRVFTHAIASREGHGIAEGIFGGVEKMVTDAIKAGGN
jgi:hypothetical protein